MTNKIHIIWNKNINVNKNKWSKGDMLLEQFDNNLFNNEDELIKSLNKKGIKVKYKLRDELFVQVPGLKQTRGFKIKNINI